MAAEEEAYRAAEPEAEAQHHAERHATGRSCWSTQIPYALGWSAVVMSLPFISGHHLASGDIPATSFSPS